MILFDTGTSFPQRDPGQILPIVYLFIACRLYGQCKLERVRGVLQSMRPRRVVLTLTLDSQYHRCLYCPL